MSDFPDTNAPKIRSRASCCRGSSSVEQADEGRNQDPIEQVFSEVERAALSPEDAESWRTVLREGLRTGVDGWVDDMVSLAHPWAVDVTAITTTSFVWHGREDEHVPPTHAEWLASRMPGATTHVLAGEGHTLTRTHVPQILAELAETAG